MPFDHGTRRSQINPIDLHGTSPYIQISDGTGTEIDIAGFKPDGSLTARVPFGEVPSGAQNSNNAVFTLSGTPVVGTVSVYRNGVYQNPPWVTVSGSTITWAVPPHSTDQIWATGLY